MKLRLRWAVSITTLAVAVLALLGWAVGLKSLWHAAATARKTAAAPVASSASTKSSVNRSAVGAPALQLSEHDVWRVSPDPQQPSPQPFIRTLAISGNVQAVRSVWLKASSMGTITDISVREGDVVQQGQVLVVFDPADAQQRLVQAQAQVTSAQSQLGTAQRNQRSNAALVQQGFISANAAANSAASLQQAQTTLQSALAAAAIARKALSDLRLRAPFGGIISRRLGQSGDRVLAETRIVEIVDMRELEMQINLSLVDAGLVRPGQRARLVTPAGAPALLAHVDRISPATQSSNGTVSAWLRLEPHRGVTLRHNQYLQGDIELARSASPVVPVSAIHFDQPSPYVQLIVNNRVTHRTVELGPVGMSAGESVRAVDVPPGAIVLRAGVGILPEGTALVLASKPEPAAAAIQTPSATPSARP